MGEWVKPSNVIMTETTMKATNDLLFSFNAYIFAVSYP